VSCAGDVLNRRRGALKDSSAEELTVKSHIGRIFVKLDLRDRAAAIVYAYDHGLVTPRYST
jgi:hypothetical protein